MLPVLIEGQVEISLKGAARRGEGRAGCFGLLSVAYNLIWFEFGMHPRVGHSLRKCVPTPSQIVNNLQSCRKQTSMWNTFTCWNVSCFLTTQRIDTQFNLCLFLTWLRLKDYIGICLVFAAFQTVLKAAPFSTLMSMHLTNGSWWEHLHAYFKQGCSYAGYAQSSDTFYNFKSGTFYYAHEGLLLPYTVLLLSVKSSPLLCHPFVLSSSAALLISWTLIWANTQRQATSQYV